MKKYTLILWLLLILVGSNQLKADKNNKICKNVTAKLYTDVSSFDICDDSLKKNFSLAIYIGAISKSDSCFGFNFGLVYNKEKIHFISGLYVNTISEYFADSRSVNPENDSGFTWGYAGTIGNVPVAGDLPLIAMYGNYTGKCPDTADIKLLYLEFTDECKDTVVDTINVTLTGYIANKTDRYVSMNFNKDNSINDTATIQEKDSSIYLYGNLKYNTKYSFNKIRYEIILDNNDDFTIDSIIANSDKISIDTLYYESNKYISDITIKDTINNIDSILKFKIKCIKNKSCVSKIICNPIKVTDCACVTNYFCDSIIVKKEYNKPSSVEENNNLYTNIWLDKNNKKIKINNINDIINKIEIYDLQGNIINTIKIENCKKEVEQKIDNYINGTYIILLKNENKVIYKKQIIINF